MYCQEAVCKKVFIEVFILQLVPLAATHLAVGHLFWAFAPSPGGAVSCRRLGTFWWFIPQMQPFMLSVEQGGLTSHF